MVTDADITTNNGMERSGVRGDSREDRQKASRKGAKPQSKDKVLGNFCLCLASLRLCARFLLGNQGSAGRLCSCFSLTAGT